MTDRPIRIGLGDDGPRAHAYAAVIARMAGWELVGAADQSDSKVSGVICTTRKTAVAAISRGTPVLLDAGAGTSEQIDQLHSAAVKAGVALVVASHWRFHEVVRSFRVAVDADELGPPAFFHWVDEGNDEWSGDPRMGAGIGIDLALWLLGDQPARVYARPTGAEGLTISIRLLNGVNALVERRAMPATEAGYGFAWLLGPRGEVRWDQRADGLTVNGGSTRSLSPDLAGCLRAQLAHAVDCWSGASDAAPGITAARLVARTLAAAKESVRLGQPVTVTADEQGGDR